MLIFDKISGLFTNRTSTHSSDPPQLAPSSPPSDATSDQIQRAQTASGRNTALSSVDSGATLVQLDGASSSGRDDTHSYAEESRTPHHDSRSVRTSAPAGHTVPARGLGMNRWGGKHSSAHGTERPKPTDEQRLFPNYKEPGDAVPILPSGASRIKSKANFKNLGFKPVDRITSKARDSGPVRAQGKSKEPSRYSSPTSSTLHSSHDGNGLERPPKRQRRDNSDTGVITLFSDDDMGPPVGMGSPSVTGNSARRSSFSSQVSSKTRRAIDPLSNMTRLGEYRDVEQNVKPPRTPSKGNKRLHPVPDDDEDGEEKFTENAARERREKASTVSTPKLNEVLDSAEVPTIAEKVSSTRQIPNPLFRDGSGPKGKNKRTSHAANKELSTIPPRHRGTQGKERDSSHDDVESPDELQGDATVQRVPRSLTRDHTTNPSEAKAIVLSDEADTGVKPDSAETRSTISKSTSQGKGKTAKTNTNIRTGYLVFEAVYLRKGNHVLRSADGKFKIEVDQKTHMVKADPTKPNFSREYSFSLKKVMRIIKGAEPSLKVFLFTTKMGAEDNRIDIEFRSLQEKWGFFRLIKQLDVKVQEKESDWMDNALNLKEQQLLASEPNGRKRPSEGSGSDPELVPLQNPVMSKRQKVTDSLKDYTPQGLAGPPLRPASKHRESSLSYNPQPSSLKAQDGAVNIPVKKYTPNTSATNRATRSMARREQPATVVCDDEDDAVPIPMPKGKLKKWQKPLVYPRFGKKKAEVSSQDLGRLRESEFLNDNLIGFYIRFLEDHLARRNEEVAKRVYFFNSYFFATLTNLPRRTKAINYEGVEKWTRNVNLFNYDYIVVPINEDAHWYVAIICNLPELQRISKPDATEGEANKESSKEAEEEPAEENKESSAQPDGESQEVPETPVLSQEPSFEKEDNQDVDPRKEETRQRLASMSLSDKDFPRESHSQAAPTEADWPAQEENPTSSPAKFSSPASKPQAATCQTRSKDPTPAPKGSPSKQRAYKRKNPFARTDPEAPTIITFDSLNMNRSPTITTLREYLRAEAQSKQGMKIDTSHIYGTKAREIPLQSNFSDCGLYLLAYVEKFVQDPDTFIRKLLQKEMDEKTDWPRLRPGLLRSRLREFLDDLYDEQAHLTTDQANEKTLMVDQRPITYLLGAPAIKPAKDSESEDGRKSEDRKSPSPKRSLSPVNEACQARPESTNADSNQPPDPEEDNSDAEEYRPATAQPAQSHAENTSPEMNGVSKKQEKAPDASVEVVEVPDSQEQDRNHLPVPPPSPPRVVISQTIPNKSQRKAHKQETAAHAEGEKAHGHKATPEIIPESDNESAAKASAVEIQIPQQSSPRNSTSSRNTRKVSKSPKQKSKHSSG